VKFNAGDNQSRVRAGARRAGTSPAPTFIIQHIF
jgi:hypothetical protein